MLARPLIEGPLGRDLAQGDGRLPFRVMIGVTGHRQLGNEARIADDVVRRLSEIRELFPPSETTPVVFTVLSALAEGADRLVAQQALETLADAEIELEAILPLPLDDYRSDFPTEASRAAFEHLLDQSSTQIALEKRSRRHGPERDAAYQRAGYLIADRSDVMIAVWDGRPAGGPGGTADVVEYAQTAEVPLLIVAAGEGAAPDEPATPAAIEQSSSRLDEALEAFRRLDEYNQVAIAEKQARRVRRSLEEELGPAVSHSQIRWQLRQVIDWTLPRLTRADLLAMRHQSRYLNLTRVIHFLAAFAVAAVAAQVAFGLSPRWLAFEIGLLGLLIVILWAGRRGRLHERWIGYRSLAENFRSGLFLAVCGVAAKTDQRVDAGPLPEGREPWFQRLFTEAWGRHPTPAIETSDAPELRRFLVDAWIDQQIAYHRAKARNWQRLRNRYTRAIGGLAAVTIVVAALHITGVRPEWDHWFDFLAITLPGFGAALTGLREHAQHRLHQERSTRTATRLERLKAQSGSRVSPASVRKLAVETQRVIVEENLDWSGVIEFQDLELVI